MRREGPEASLLRKKRKLLSRIFEEFSEGKAVILVEGKKDREALRRCGIEGRILVMNQTPDKIAEKVAEFSDEAILLTDFDEAGEDLLKRMNDALLSHNVKPNVDLRRRLRYITGVRFFENLDAKLRELESRFKRCGIEEV